jgi:eukaryotic-like serine/threonine-protein kinase
MEKGKNWRDSDVECAFRDGEPNAGPSGVCGMTERSIFLAMLEIDDPAARSAYLDQACIGDPGMRAQVEQLLEAHQEPGPFMERSAAALVATDDEPVSEHPGTVIGPYRLLEQIGEGGFGIVFMAEQTQPVRRKVALKVVKPGMDTRQVVARFEAERQAVALMHHPNIAHVYDGGETATGRPYFVMELVHGIPITEFCDQNHLPVRERLELFVGVCQAVQHAHQKGIIHRDLKPSNVLVTLHDGTPVSKVIDFGIAKVTGQQLTEKTLFTNFAQMLGTPLYMSPEQAQLSGLDADTRTDIYSLGVLLYELLTSTTPCDKERLKTAAYDEIRRIIREEEPAKPSTRITTLGAAAMPVSANRNSDPRRLSQLVRGELDWIVMKALEKDRNRRYETASAFAADIQRYLNDEPVLACPPSARYQLRKFVRRNKGVLLTASAVVLAVSLTAAVSTLLIWRANQNLQEALGRERRDSYFHRIALAHRELSANNLGGALQLLDECSGDLCHWEWHYLQGLCRVDPVTLQGRGRVYGLAISPDSRRLAAGNEDGRIGLFDLETGAALPPLRGHTRAVRSVAFHPHGTRLASASADGTVRLWDLTTSQQVFDPWRGHAEPRTYGLAFSPDGRRLAANDADGSVVLYDLADGQELRRFTGDERTAVCVDFSPDGRLLVTGTWTGALQLWDAETGDLLCSIRQGHGMTLSAAKFSSDGRHLATAGYDRLVKLWDVAKLLDPATGYEPRAWRGHDCIVVGLAFSPDGQRLATIGHEDKTVKLWDPLTGREILSLREHTYGGSCVVFSPDGRRLASSARDGTIRIRDANPASAGQELRTLRHDGEVWSVAFSPDGQRIASSSFDKTARLWDAATGAALHRLPLSSQGYLVAFSRDGQRLASVSRDKTARIWDVASGRLLRAFRTPNDHLYGATFSPDGQYLVVADVGGKDVKEAENHAVTVWDANTDQAQPKVVGIVGRHREPIWCLKFSPDGKCLASGCNDETGKLWRWNPFHSGQPQEPLLSLPVRPGWGDCVAFTPNGERLVTVGEEHTVKVWDSRTGKELHRLPGHSGDVAAVAISPDGRWLASAGEDSTVALWDTETWKRRQTLRGHTGMVMSLAFSPDSRRLVSGSRDGTVKLWDMMRWGKAPDR